MSFEDAFLSQEKLLRTLYFVLAGIFIVGYSNWKQKIKE
jgi:predicted transporter